MATTPNSTNSSIDWRPIAIRHADQISRIMNWSRLGTVEQMQIEAADQAKNRQAESAYVRKTVWGSDEISEDENVGNTVLGDITNPTPIIVPQSQSSNAIPIIAGMLLSTLLGAGGAGAVTAYMLSQAGKTAVESPRFDDESVSIGLGKIDDYTKTPTVQP